MWTFPRHPGPALPTCIVCLDHESGDKCELTTRHMAEVGVKLSLWPSQLRAENRSNHTWQGDCAVVADS